MREEKTKIILISHTHWDREWYYTFDQYRYRLVRCIDMLLEIFKKKPNFKCFMMDGQVAPIEDYLEIRPEKEEILRKYIGSGRIKIGPWYIQPDEFLVSGESLIRNLMLGIRTARKYGGYLKIGYLPDTFGHTAQLPQILQGFGLDNFVFHRGLGPEFEDLGSYFIWKAPDGSRVITIFLYRGYCNLIRLPKEPNEALEYIKALYETWKERIAAPVIPGMVGCDHSYPKEYLPEIEEYVKKKKDLPFTVEQGTLEDVVEILRKYVNKLKEYSGEFLSSYYHPVLYGTWSSRMYLKQYNFENEVLLSHIVEPLWTLVWLLKGEYPSEFINKAWKYVILSQPHDSICGCSIDEVHKECLVRQIKAKTLLQEMLQCNGKYFNVLHYFITASGIDFSCYALPVINSYIDLDFDKDALAYLVVYNTLPWDRRDVIRVKLPRRIVLDSNYLRVWESVALSKPSSSIKEKVEKEGCIVIDSDKLMLRDSKGNIIKCQAKKVDENNVELTWVDNIPAYGYKAYALIPSKEVEISTDIKVGDNFIENEYFKVTINDNGTINIEDKRNGNVYNSLNIFEDGGDMGDEYDYSPPPEDLIVESKDFKASTEIIEKGPYVATAKIYLEMLVPESLTEDRKKRSERKIKLPITCFISLYSKVPRIDIKVIVDNKAKDHRLRVKFPVDISVDNHYAETHFYVIERPNKPIHFYRRHDGKKAYITTFPTRLWIDVSDGKKGLCIVTKGLPEYEVRKKENNVELIITLMRCIGWLSRADLLTRQGHAGPMIATEDAQMLGTHTFEYSIIPHNDTWKDAKVYKLARDFIVPLIAHEDLPHKGILKDTYSFMKIEPDEIVISAIKKAEDDDSMVVRAFNIVDREIEAKITLPKNVKRAWLTNLNEEIIKEIESVSKNLITLKVPPHKIITIKIQF